MEIEFIGTGGQGSVVAAKLLCDAATKAEHNSQSLASYGSQRRGGEVESYIRIEKDKIIIHAKMTKPDYLVLMDEEYTRIPQQRSLGKKTKIILNTSKQAKDFPELAGYEVTTINANRIAAEKGLTLPSGMPIINTTVLGAVVRVIPDVELDHLLDALADGKIPALEKNLEAARAAYDAVGKPPDAAATEAVEAAVPVTEFLPEFIDLMPPCEASCPAGEKIERTAYFIQHGHFEDALESIKAENPFPGICGRVCFHPCETACNRVQFDEGIATNNLERAAYDYADAGLVKKPKKRPSTGKKVAIIGSGPAGMTCAYYLSLLGHGVTVFEAQPVAGGVPRFGIPEYRLPKKVVEREIKEITDLGVETKTNTRVGKDVTYEELKQKYDACLIAAGAHRSMKLNVPGENIGGVTAGLDLLKRVALGERVDVGNRVAVIGGGNTAVDSARTARRLGAKEVTIVYRRSTEEMPAYQDEVVAAEKEGIKIEFLAMPVRVLGNGNRVSGIECVRAKLGEKDESGRPRPEPIDGSNFTINTDTIVTALGENLDLPLPDGMVKMSGAVIETDGLGRTSVPGLYAGGDAASLSRSVVEAIASGKRAAIGIDVFLSNGDEKAIESFQKGTSGAVSMSRYLTGDYTGDSNHIVSYEDLNTAHFTNEPRLAAGEVAADTRIKNFDETNLGLTKEDAVVEAQRCFHCGTCILCEICYISCPDTAIFLEEDRIHLESNHEICKSCGICIYECPRHAISWKGVA